MKLDHLTTQELVNLQSNVFAEMVVRGMVAPAQQATNTQSAAIAQIAARLEHRVRTDGRMSKEDSWCDVVTEAVRQLRAL